ncbi:MAG: hypothetical protein J1G05_05265 [Clostridiales bacterium]|nr:hypothetical protein [Clostridiales bacterium]
MMLENGMNQIDDRPMSMRSKEEIDAVIAEAPSEMVEQWLKEAGEIAKQLGIISKSEE